MDGVNRLILELNRTFRPLPCVEQASLGATGRSIRERHINDLFTDDLCKCRTKSGGGLCQIA